MDKKARLQISMKKLSFLLALSLPLVLSADDFCRGMPLPSLQSGAVISQSSRSEDRWMFSVNAAFNEYQALQDSMEVAFPSSTLDGFYPGNTVSEGSIVGLDFDYHPGFTVGFLLETPNDGWNFGGKYLWYRGHSHVSKSADPDVYYSSPLLVGPYDIAIGSLKANWHLGIDLIDLYLSRPYLSGHHLSVTPLLGLRGGWIRDHFDLAATNFVAPSNTQTAETNSRAWVIGPKAGLQSNYLVGAGFSFFADIATSALYSCYNALSLEYENYLDETSRISDNDYSTFRSILDAGIGVNWTFTGKYKFSFNAAYNLSIFFSQNMERILVSMAGATQGTPGNLYLSGLSIGASFDF